MIEKVFDKSYTIKHGGVSKSASAREAYLDGYAEDANRRAEQILEAMLKD